MDINMTQDTHYLNHYYADEGKVLWKDGAYGLEIWLGVTDNIVNWEEISEEEANARSNSN